MELSRTIGTVAVVLGVVLAAGFAVGEDGAQVSKTAPQTTGQMKLEEREAQRRVALEEQQKRKDAFERACNKPLKSDMDFDRCRTAYKRLQLVN
jgi:hypothetical protein